MTTAYQMSIKSEFFMYDLNIANYDTFKFSEVKNYELRKQTVKHCIGLFSNQHRSFKWLHIKYAIMHSQCVLLNNLYINLRRSRDCRLYATPHLLIFVAAVTLHINALSI